jgi:beta-galactosidase/beta-glucuronidase
MREPEWKICEGKIQTRWAKQVDPTCPLPEYPRPQMVRDEWKNLNGLWDYAITNEEDDLPAYGKGKILVPFPVESALSGVGKALLPDEELWYRRTFTIPADWMNKRILLHFGAVDWFTQVWLNGELLGEHQGGYDPFTFELSGPVWFDGDNELIVCVRDPSNKGRQERGKQTLTPGFVFYTAVSGIWQTVWLEAVPEVFIRDIKLTPSVEPAQLEVQVDVSDAAADERVQVQIWEGQNKVGEVEGSPGEKIILSPESVRLWSPEDPYLYDLKIKLLQDSQVVDEVGSYCGFREIKLQKDNQGVPRILLNGQQIFQFGPLDQGYWPDGLYTAPTDEALRFDIEFCKSLGMNMIRKHIKVEPARWYYHCDRLGMLVWQDMPCGGKVPHTLVLGMGFLLGLKIRDDRHLHWFGRQDAQVRENFRRELKAMMTKLHNHPSIVIWVPFNESWGQFNAKEIGDWVKTKDPSRLVDPASGWFDQGNGDIYSIHKYVGPSMPRVEDERAVALSEFGGLGLKVEGHLWQEEKLFAYRMVKSEEDLTDWYQKMMQKLLVLKQKGLVAAIYTELCDVEYEINGYLTYDREVMKMDKKLIQAAHLRIIAAK